MPLIAIETCSSQCSIAIADNDRILYQQSLNHSKHAEVILQMIDEGLSTAGLHVQDVKSIAVSNGPGSFTGVRTGLSVASGLALPANLPIYTTSSLAILAYQGEQHANHDQFILTALDARMNEVYFGIWQLSHGSLSMIGKLGVYPPIDIPLPTDLKSSIAIGAGWDAYWSVFPESVREQLSPSTCLPTANHLANMVLQKHPAIRLTSAQALSALYVRDQIASPKR